MLKIASFFAGVGGLDYGAHLLKEHFEFVFINDFNKNACETYRLNHPDIVDVFKEGDIKQFLDNLPDHDILLGGFPCQSWSLAGLRKGFDDIRGLEVFSLTKALSLKQPSYFIFENVKGILSHDEGKSIKTIVESLDGLGYNVHYETIVMSDYGVPQKRERVVFFGVKKTIDLDPKLLVPPPTAKGVILNDVLASITDELDTNNHNNHVSTHVKQHWFKVLKEGENLALLSEEEIYKREEELGLEHKKKPNTQQGYRRMDGSQIATTMAFGNMCLPVHPREDRNLSVRECATIQSFPKDFVFTGGLGPQYKQVANAVPPLFSVELFKHLKGVLKMDTSHEVVKLEKEKLELSKTLDKVLKKIELITMLGSLNK